MTEPHTNEIFAVQWAGLAREIAMDIFELKTILEVHRLSEDEWEQIQKHPKFQEILKDMIREWNSAASTRDRIRVKAATGLEMHLEVLINALADDEIPLAQRTEAAKFIARIGEIDTTNVLSGGGGGGGFNISINIGDQHKVLEIPANQIPVIEYEE